MSAANIEAAERPEQMRFKGDDKLSANDRDLWSLCYSTLIKFGCATMFKVYGPDARVQLDRHIRFYVPGQHPRAGDVKAYLEEELRAHAHAGGSDPEWHWATTVSVEFFSGVDWYLTREECEPLTEKAVESFMALLEERKKQSN